MKTDPCLPKKDFLLNPTKKITLYALSSSLQLVRNLKRFPFPHWTKDAQRLEILSLCKEAVHELPNFKDAPFYAIAELSETEKKHLVEAQLITRNFAQSKPGSGLIICDKQNTIIRINDEDHLAVQILKKGLSILPLWETLDAIDSQLEKSLDFAFSQELGYLTSLPSNAGTGLHASVTMHLPGLVISNQLEHLISTVHQLHISVSNAFGDILRPPGSFFKINSLQTLGHPETTILKRFSTVIKAIIEKELEARKKLLETKQKKLFDKIGRAYGILTNSHSLAVDEAIHFLSIMRLASELKIFPSSILPKIDNLLIGIQPTHLILSNPQLTTQDDACDILRATFLRQELTSIPAPNFNSTVSTHERPI